MKNKEFENLVEALATESLNDVRKDIRTALIPDEVLIHVVALSVAKALGSYSDVKDMVTEAIRIFSDSTAYTNKEITNTLEILLNHMNRREKRIIEYNSNYGV